MTETTKQDMENRIKDLESMLEAMHSDFAKVAKDDTSPCFFCANDDACNGPIVDCKFVWAKHNLGGQDND